MFLFFSANGLPISVKARLSGRSRSSFYYKRKQPTKDKHFLEQVEGIHKRNPFYGYKRIAGELGVSHKRAYRMMRLHAICAKSSRKRRSKNQYSIGKASLPNHLKDMTIARPNQAWAGDFTHFTWKRYTYYLATVMDIYTREIVGWHVASNHSVELVKEALKMALGKRSKTPIIFHSDHGSEYISDEYVSKLKEHGITPSNSAKGKPWQNGFVESFNGRFKEELGDPNRFPVFEKLFQALCSQFTIYNTQRIHSKLKMPPSVFYHQKMVELEGPQRLSKMA
jgi:putative transposase